MINALTFITNNVINFQHDDLFLSLFTHFAAFLHLPFLFSFFIVAMLISL